MRIQVGCDGDVYGTIAIVGNKLEVDPATPADGTLLGNLIDHYGESLAMEGVSPANITPRAILNAMLDRLAGRTWAKLIEA